MADVWGSGFKNAMVSGRAEGGFLSCAVKKETDPAEVYFKYSPTLSAWPADGSAVLVGTLGTENLACHVWQKFAARKSQLIITNGVDRVWVSVNGGATWTSI